MGRLRPTRKGVPCLHRRALLKGMASISFLSFSGIPAYARFVESRWMEITWNPVPVRGLPGPFEGFSIAQVSDIHYQPGMSLAYVERAVEHLDRLNPHLVVLTGDFLYGPDEARIHPLAAVLARIEAPHGVLAVPGNHDYWIYTLRHLITLSGKERTVFHALEKAGIRVLRNESVLLERGGAALPVVGLDDYWARRVDVETAFRNVPSSSPRVVLAHNPDVLLHLKRRRVDLLLCGHTHGGQVNLPFLGPLFVPLQLTKFVSGAFRDGNRSIYVNRGLGWVGLPLRLNARPEITLHVLHGTPA